jgi:hypothetical protein
MRLVRALADGIRYALNHRFTRKEPPKRGEEKVELRQLKLFCPRHRQLVALRGRVSALGQSPGELIARGAYPKTPYSLRLYRRPSLRSPWRFDPKSAPHLESYQWTLALRPSSLDTCPVVQTDAPCRAG